MTRLQDLFDSNRCWAQGLMSRDPSFLPKLSERQAPGYLWIGCSDSRVPASQIVGVGPGELFVHRNIANLVIHSDVSCLAVLQYAVEHLKVPHIIVCGHYGCGGLRAALGAETSGPVDDWLRHAREVIRKHQESLDKITDETQRWRKLCELNVIEQAMNVSSTYIVQEAWRCGREVAVHGWLYELADGMLKDMNVSVMGQGSLESTYERALSAWT
jgi:carbonic anhydrase